MMGSIVRFEFKERVFKVVLGRFVKKCFNLLLSFMFFLLEDFWDFLRRN